MDLEIFSVIVAIVAIIINIILAIYGFKKSIWLYEFSYTPVAFVIGVWPLYLNGILDPLQTAAILVIGALPVAISLWKFSPFAVPVAFLVWCIECTVIFYNDLSKFIITQLFPAFSQLVNAIIIIVICMIVLYASLFICLYIGSWIDSIRYRRNY